MLREKARQLRADAKKVEREESSSKSWSNSLGYVANEYRAAAERLDLAADNLETEIPFG